MSEKGIIFSVTDVKAILDGRKTQTRRVIKPQPQNCPILCNNVLHEDKKKGIAIPTWVSKTNAGSLMQIAPYYIGDVLWARETWNQNPVTEEYVYLSDSKNIETSKKNYDWRPSSNMPRAAARIFLRVTDVRVERLQDISNQDIIKEGIRLGIGGHPYFNLIDAYIALWNSLNAKRGFSWESNPYVWVIEFERIDKYDAE